MQRRVVVLDGASAPSLVITRSLARAGYEVWVGSDRFGALAQHSSACAESFVYPDPSVDRTAFVDFLRGFVMEHRPALVVPVTDWTVVPLAEHRSTFEALTALAIAPQAGLEVTLNKSMTVSLAASLGVAVPETWVVRDGAVPPMPASRYPMVVKTGRSKTWDTSGSGQHHQVRYAFSREELESTVGHLSRSGEVLVQEHVRGAGIGVAAMAVDGRAHALVQYRRIHEVPVSGGGSSYRETEALDPRLAAQVRRMLAELEWTGVAMFEFKRHARHGEALLLEINGRFWGSLALSVRAGVDFPLMVAEHYLDGRIRCPVGYQVGTRARSLARELEWFKDVVVRDGAPEITQYPSALSVLSDTARLFLDGPSGLDVADRYDTAPIRDVLGRMAGAQLRSVRLKAQLAHIGKRVRRERQAFRIPVDTRRIHFVCHGNIMRSAYAEVLLKALDTEGRFEISSSGLFAREGRPAHATVVQYAAARGLSLTEHRSTASAEMPLGHYDLVVGMERRHLLRLDRTHGYPAAVMLSTFDTEEPLDIHDPDGRPDEAVDAIMDRVDSAVRGLYERLSRGNSPR